MLINTIPIMPIDLEGLTERQKRHLAKHGFGVTINTPQLSKNTITIRFSEDTDSYLRSLPNRNYWLRDVVDRAIALERSVMIKPARKQRSK